MAETSSQVPLHTPYSGLIISCPDFSKEEIPVRGEEPADYLLPPIGIGGPLAPNVPLNSSLSEIAARATNVSKDFPSVWFVNFPTSLSGDQKRELQQYQQEVLDYRSWSSLNWWREVFRRFPPSDSKESKIRQSRELAKIAYLNMKETSWLQTTKDTNTGRRIECKTSEFHGRLIAEVTSGFIQLNQAAIAALEPLLMSIVRSINETVSFHDIRTLVTEKYEYLSYSNSIRSYVRLICFEVTESFYHVRDGKSGSQRYVVCDISFLDYEAVFRSDQWAKYSGEIHAQQKDAMKSFVNQQTVDVPP